MNKILPMEYPPITSYPSVAHILAAVWPLQEEMMPWFCQQYIQLASTKEFGSFYDSIHDYMLSYPIECPFFEYQIIDKRILYHYPERLSEFLEHYILHDCYIIASVDEYYVNCAWNYHKNHHVHQALIYGCDTSEKKFYISDFFGDKYRQAEISYEFVDEGDSYISKDLAKWYHDVTIFNYLERHEPFQFNIELVKISINDYINCRDSFHKMNFSRYEDRRTYCYGLQYYDNMVESLLEKKENYDIKQFHVLYDHKIAMLIRLDYLYQNSYLDTDSYHRLVHEMTQLKKENLSLRQMILVYNLRPQRIDLDTVIQKCISLKQKEYETFSFLLKALS